MKLSKLSSLALGIAIAFSSVIPAEATVSRASQQETVSLQQSAQSNSAEAKLLARRGFRRGRSIRRSRGRGRGIGRNIRNRRNLDFRGNRRTIRNRIRRINPMFEGSHGGRRVIRRRIRRH